MTAKKMVKGIEMPGTPIRYSKEQLLESVQYKGRRDLIQALLRGDGAYSCEEAEEIINQYKKGKVE